MGKKSYYCYTDAGGTFTDTFIIDGEGNFFSGKAHSTPKALADGHIGSLEAALTGKNIELTDFFPDVEVIGFGTTAIINTVLTRSGIKTGLIITKGFSQTAISLGITRATLYRKLRTYGIIQS